LRAEKERNSEEQKQKKGKEVYSKVCSIAHRLDIRDVKVKKGLRGRGDGGEIHLAGGGGGGGGWEVVWCWGRGVGGLGPHSYLRFARETGGKKNTNTNGKRNKD